MEELNNEPPQEELSKAIYSLTSGSESDEITPDVCIKAFDLVSRNGLFKRLGKIGCLPKFLTIIKSFHKNTLDSGAVKEKLQRPFQFAVE